MIKYRLICKNCNDNFDSWFSSSKEYEKLKKKKYLTCCKCNSTKVEKTLMSPNISCLKSDFLVSENDKKYGKIKKKINEYQKFIKKNFEYVGENFTYEARAIHYNSKKKSKGIYGSASHDEIRELNEEGIETQVIPLINGTTNN
jgi:hypothetical protein|tara:strand:- start:180 stop:611 length:432 start_codon:yes stop_codon:yes gene_type:complete